MTNKTQTINPLLPVELVFTPAGMSKPFKVTGDYESVAPLAQRVLGSTDASTKPVAAIKSADAPILASAPKSSPAASRMPLRDVLTFKHYDRMHGTTRYQDFKDAWDYDQATGSDYYRNYQRAIAYDNHNYTNFYKELKDQLQLQKDLTMAQRLGLLQEEVCAKHRKALNDVKKIR